MKSRFSTVDIKAVLHEIREQFLGLRVANIYDVDNKTYLLKFTKPESKKVLLIESGIRLHITEYDWPKSNFPSGFSMKMRKHLKSRRLEVVKQLGNDRIVQLQFGSGEAAYHIILELYDRGNIILSDHEFSILNILRPRADNSQDVKYAVREKYPLDLAKPPQAIPTIESLHDMLLGAKTGDNLRKVLNPKLAYGPAVIDHSLQAAGFPPAAAVGKGFDIACDLSRLLSALELAEELMKQSEEQCQGYIIQKVEKKATISHTDSRGDNSNKESHISQTDDELLVYDEFHPFLYKQHEDRKHLHFTSFNQAVDQFYSQLEAQKIELKTIQAERSALKKLDNVKRDHEKRLQELQTEQEIDERKAYIIQINLDMVEKALSVVRSALANQIDWTDIDEIIKEAQSHGDPVALAIKSLKLKKNHFTMLLRDHYEDEREKPVPIDIDIALSAYANAKRYFDQKKHASQKERKTVESSTKALKSAEKKTKQVLKEMKVTANIVKARKVMWFEKFNWFVSSENYLVIAGRDGQQNEILVRRYLRPGDVYVHADIHGASSVIIKNTHGGDIPPKTLNEAGTMAICHSAAWDAKVVTSAWWVYHDQVSKTAPSGEYLSTGSFMIRGKKNYLPPSYLVYGFGLLFKLDDDSIERHRGERKVRVIEDGLSSLSSTDNTDSNRKEVGGDLVDGQEVGGDLADGQEAGGDLADGQEVDIELDIESDDSDEGDEEETKESAAGSRLETLREDQTEDDAAREEVEEESGEFKEEVEREETHSASEEKGSADGTDECNTHIAEGKEAGLEEQEAGPGEEGGDFEFPDTEIQLEHVSSGVGDDKFALRQRSISQVSSGSGGHDDVTDTASVSGSNVGGGKAVLSRKQRREMKKAKKQGALQSGTQNYEDTADIIVASDDVIQAQTDTNQSSPAAAQPAKSTDSAAPQTGQQTSQQQNNQQSNKRGQSGKLKKMKKKYSDQDEEERELRLEILQSAQRETKKRIKMKQQEKQKAEKAERQAEIAKKQQEYKKKRQDAHKAAARNPSLGIPADLDDDIGEGGDNPLSGIDETGVLDSLTGLPVEDDSLLYAVPFCAPYTALQNFKYKVKLIPGNTKRGKAVKASVQAFMFDRTITQREKDLIKSLKDVDMSRNVPGKVKVTSSQVNKAKSKK